MALTLNDVLNASFVDNGDGTYTMRTVPGAGGPRGMNSTNTMLHDAFQDNGDGTYSLRTTGAPPAGSVTSTQIADGTIAVVDLSAAVQAKLITQQPAIPNIGAAPSQADFNGLLAALRLAGVIAP